MQTKAITLMRGVTMIEMLIALLIISFGLLGLAGLQSRGQQFNHEAYMRTQATALAYDMIDRMRANCPVVSNNAPDERCNVVGNGLYDNTTVPAGAMPNNCLNITCSPQQLAAFDTWEWGDRIATTWPDGGQGTITWNVANQEYNLTISWFSREFDQTITLTWVF